MGEKGVMVMDRMVLALMAVLVVPAIAPGQEPAVPVAAPTQAEAPAQAPSPVVQEPAATPAAVQAAPAVAPMPLERRRPSIRMMEAVLSRAVLGGAEQLAEQLGSGNPNVSFFTGQARARGFILDGYGVFFHVEIPEMQSSLVMSVTALERDVAVANTIESLRRAVEGVPDGAPRLQIEQALRRLQIQVGSVQQLADSTTAANRGMIRATETTPVADPIAPVPMPVFRDPSAVYREAIKSALVDAMLEHSRGMNIQPDEWLTVAAQRGDSPLSPNEIVTSSTLVLRIKGSDLAVYDADRTRKDEIRKRVEVREF
jgi:hypothetical protein